MFVEKDFVGCWFVVIIIVLTNHFRDEGLKQKSTGQVDSGTD